MNKDYYIEEHIDIESDAFDRESGFGSNAEMRKGSAEAILNCSEQPRHSSSPTTLGNTERLKGESALVAYIGNDADYVQGLLREYRSTVRRQGTVERAITVMKFNSVEKLAQLARRRDPCLILAESCVVSTRKGLNVCVWEELIKFTDPKSSDRMKKIILLLEREEIATLKDSVPKILLESAFRVCSKEPGHSRNVAMALASVLRDCGSRNRSI